LIPGLNDSRGELKDIARFVAELGPETPWHVSRFHPSYKMTDRPPTPPETIAGAVEIGRSAGLRYVYAGNLPGSEAESTFCSKCRALLIERWGFSVRRYELVEGSCPRCEEPLDGIGLERFKAA
ncbi:MAG: radical SAM protein, partial [Nitrospinota bacterium]